MLIARLQCHGNCRAYEVEHEFTNIIIGMRHDGRSPLEMVLAVLAEPRTSKVRGRGRQAAVAIPCPRGMKFLMPKTSQWYAKKPYPHFDLPLGRRKATEYVSDPRRIAQHPFYPLIQYSLVRPRIKKCDIGDCRGFVKDPKLRTIAYPSHKDGYIFSYYKSKLEPTYEAWLASEGLGEAVTAFRSIGENNITLAKKAFDFIETHPGCEIIATDIESFFDKIDHATLKEIWQRFLGVPRLPEDHFAVYKAVTRYSVVERHKIYNKLGIPLTRRGKGSRAIQRLCTPDQFRAKIIPSGLIQPSNGAQQGIGIPQGTSLSPLLSNMYLADLDSEIHGLVTGRGGRYWRYCDDILIVLPGGETDAIFAKLDRCLESLKLTRSHEKRSDSIIPNSVPNGNSNILGLYSMGRTWSFVRLLFTDTIGKSKKVHWRPIYVGYKKPRRADK